MEAQPGSSADRPRGMSFGTIVVVMITVQVAAFWGFAAFVAPIFD